MGADDIKSNNESIEIITPKDVLEPLRKAYDHHEYVYDILTITKIPTSTIDITVNDFEKLERLFDQIDDDDDVQNLYSNVLVIDNQ